MSAGEHLMTSILPPLIITHQKNYHDTREEESYLFAVQEKGEITISRVSGEVCLSLWTFIVADLLSQASI